MASRTNSVGISFENISYSTKYGLKRETKKILHGLNGKLPAGGLTAILGPSGSGKTTLLNILAGCITSHRGNIIKSVANPSNQLLSSVEKCNSSVSRVLMEESECEDAAIIYIPQETQLCGLITVRETFQIAAELKLSDYDQLQPTEVQNKINNVLSTLGLTKVCDTKVACISGGERKRLALGIELLSDFDVILLDEPTTGLDSISTQICTEYLKTLAQNGKTIICTIHQPSASVLEHFDYLYVLADGCCLYEGLNDQLFNVLDEYNMKCPCYHNPADFVIEIACGEHGNDSASIKSKLIERFHKAKSKTPPTKAGILKTKSVKDGSGAQSHVATPSRQLRTLLRREYLKAARNPALTYLRLATSVTNSLVLCAIFWQVGNDGAKLLFNYNAILGFVLHLMMPSLMLTILTFPTEYAILKRETLNRWYSLKWYYAAVTLIDLPICIIYCLVSNGIFYTLTAQPSELWRFATFSTLGFMICVIAQSLGLLVGSLLNVVNGTFVGSAISFPIMLFAGFGITFKDIPPYIQWIGHFSYLKYGVEGMAASVMGYNRPELPCATAKHCQYHNSQRFLDDMGVTSDSIRLDFVVLIGFFILLKALTFICLRKRVFYKA